ncbi:hypothetical protein KEM52_003896 [Ascosphaera acerosa]|nr:hypothetical protein KEM52_003896 [Ascosphaera acerosa]
MASIALAHPVAVGRDTCPRSISTLFDYPTCVRQPGELAGPYASRSTARTAEHSSRASSISSSPTATPSRTRASSTHPSSVTVPLSPTISGHQAARQQQQQQQQQEEQQAGLAGGQIDTDILLDTSHFLSFEEWREQNLAKVGQSSEFVGGRKPAASRPLSAAGGAGARGNLETLGDEGEIDFDFGGNGNGGGGDAGGGGIESGGTAADGFGRPSTRSGRQDNDRGRIAGAAAGAQSGAADDSGALEAGSAETMPDSPSHGSGLTAKRANAGVTCKERSNYASFDCAATVIRTNAEARGATAILVENKDSYMLNECRAGNKFVILELCDDILIDTVVLANFEFFSSRFRLFRVSASDRYPPPRPDLWRELGVYEALNTREIQAFPVENPLIWARYVKIEFLTHYGKEFYCPLSLIRVHGTTMMEEFKSEGDSNRAEEARAEEAVEAGLQEEEGRTLPADYIGADLRDQDGEGPDATPFTPLEDAAKHHHTTHTSQVKDDHGRLGHHTGKFNVEKLLIALSQQQDGEICGLDDFPTPTVAAHDIIAPVAGVHDSPAGVAAESRSPSSPGTSSRSAVAASADVTAVGRRQQSQDEAWRSGRPDSLSASRSEQRMTPPSSHTAHAPAPPPPPPPPPPSQPSQSPAPSTASPTAASAPAAPSPTTQESFFKSFSKRLQMLETNSTLSLMYIGEQSRLLREAFNKVERRQMGRTSAFLENLNHTVLVELHELRQQYDQVWQSVLLELDQQRLQYNRELVAVTRQLGVLADEILFQKRLSLIQAVFLLILFGFVVFSRDTVRRYLDIAAPRVQGMLGRAGGVAAAAGASPVLRGSWHRSPFLYALRSPSQSPVSASDSGSPVSEPMVQGGADGGPEDIIALDSTREGIGDDVDAVAGSTSHIVDEQLESARPVQQHEPVEQEADASSHVVALQEQSDSYSDDQFDGAGEGLGRGGKHRVACEEHHCHYLCDAGVSGRDGDGEGEGEGESPAGSAALLPFPSPPSTAAMTMTPESLPSVPVEVGYDSRDTSIR